MEDRVSIDAQGALGLDLTVFQGLLDSDLIGFSRVRPSGEYLDVNNAFAKMLGYTREEIVGKLTWRQITPPQYIPISQATQKLITTTGASPTFEKEFIRKDGRHITVLVGGVQVKGKSDEVMGFIVDITQRKADERAIEAAHAMLRKEEARFRRLMDANVIGVGFFHVDGRFLDANDALLKIAGFTRPELEQGLFRWDQLTPPEFRYLDERALEELARTGKAAPYEKEYLLRNGQRVPIVIGAAYLEGNAGEGFAFVLDNSARRAAEKAIHAANASLLQMHATLERRVAERTADLEAQTRELARSEARLRESEEHYRQLAEHNRRLAHEVEHRVRNHLAGLVGLVQVMRDKSEGVPAFADAIEGRLRAMLHVHQILAADGWQAVALGSLVQSMLASLAYLAPHPAEMAVTGSELPINPQQAMPLALIFAEWFTNSCKYGACSVPTGRLGIDWSVSTAGPRQRVMLSWTESGGPPIAGPVVASVGTALVQGFATHELQGECSMGYPPAGAAHRLRFPLEGQEGAKSAGGQGE